MSFPLTWGIESSTRSTIMTAENKNPVTAPGLNQLFSQFLKQRLSDGTTAFPLEEGSEVQLHQAASVHVVEPRTALQEALEVLTYLLPKEESAGFGSKALKSPPDWTALIRTQESLVAVPFSLGNFPQLIRNITPLLTDTDRTKLQPHGGRPIELARAAEWGKDMTTKGKWAEALFAIAELRLANQFEAARSLLAEVKRNVTPEWSKLVLNEEAALAWHCGDCENAARLWAQHPDQDSAAIQFNRGMAALFLNRNAEAITFLNRAVESIPERSVWHSLARMYLTLAESI
jgi:hypothetical protein